MNFGVIFDMDGTLIDTQRIYVEAWERAGKLQGIDGLGSYVKYVCGLKHEDSMRFAKTRHPELDTEKFFKDYYPYAQEHKSIALLPGVEKLLTFLRDNNIPMAIASSSSMDEVRDSLTRCGIIEYFSVIVSGDDVKNGKPAPDIFLLAAEKLGTPPAECFVFEDSPNGVRAADSAGMRCFGIPDVAEFTEEIRAISYAIVTAIDNAIPYLEEELNR